MQQTYDDDDAAAEDDAALAAAASAAMERRIRTEGFRKDIPLLNRAILTGRLGQDPTLIEVGRNNTALCKFSLAVTSTRVDDEGKPITSWFTIQIWGSQAPRAAAVLRKGLRVGVAGSIVIDEWKARDGSMRKAVVINARSYEILQSRSEIGFNEPATRDRSAPQQRSAPSSSYGAKANDSDDPF